MNGLDINRDLPNSPNIESEINTAILGQAQPEGYQVDPQAQAIMNNFDAAYQPAPIGSQGSELYRDANHNINVGSYSGSIVGSNPIFVPGGNIASVNPMLERQKAVDDAAKKRAAALKPFDYGDPTKLKDARFQQKFNNAYYNAANNIVTQAYEKYGDKAPLILDDVSTVEGRKMRQGLANYEVLGREMDQITDMMASIEGNLESGKVKYSEDTLNLYKDFQNLVGNFEDGDAFASQDLKSMYNKLKGARGIEDYIQQPGFLDDIMGKVTQSPYDKDKGEFYKYGTTEHTKYTESLKQVAKSLAEESALTWGVANNLYTEDDIFKVLNSRFKDSVKTTGSLTKKDKENVGGESFAENGVVFNDDKPATVNFLDYNDDGTIAPTSTDYKSYYEYDFNTSGNGNNILTVDDLKVTNKGVEQTIHGSNKVQFTGFSTVRYKDASGKDRVKVITRAKIHSTVKQPYDDDGNAISMEKYSKLSDSQKEGYTVKEGRVTIDKPVDLSDHIYAQMKEGLSPEQIKLLDKGRAGAFKRKKELLEGEDYNSAESNDSEVLTGSDFN